MSIAMALYQAHEQHIALDLIMTYFMSGVEAIKEPTLLMICSYTYLIVLHILGHNQLLEASQGFCSHASENKRNIVCHRSLGCCN